MQRVVIVGTPGNGKSTLARRIAETRSLTHIELDALYHLPDWQEADEEDFRTNIQQRIDYANRDSHGWVIDGNYASRTKGFHLAQADTVIWLDLPRTLVTWRVLRRSIRRGAKREELWNGNRESLRSIVRRDPNDNIVLWAWQQHPKYQQQYIEAQQTPEWEHLNVIRLRSPEEVDRFSETL